MNFIDNLFDNVYRFLFSDGPVCRRDVNLERDLRVGRGVPLGIRFDIFRLGQGNLDTETELQLRRSGWTQEVIARTLRDVMWWCEENLDTQHFYLETGVAMPYSLATGVVVYLPMRNTTCVTYEASTSFYASALSAVVSNRFLAHALALRQLFPLDLDIFDMIFETDPSLLPCYETTVRFFEFGTINPDDAEEYLEWVREDTYDTYTRLMLESVTETEPEVDHAKQFGQEGESNSDEDNTDTTTTEELEEIIRSWVIVKPTNRRENGSNYTCKRVEDLEELWHRYSWPDSDNDEDYEPESSTSTDLEYESGPETVEDFDIEEWNERYGDHSADEEDYVPLEEEEEEEEELEHYSGSVHTSTEEVEEELEEGEIRESPPPPPPVFRTVTSIRDDTISGYTSTPVDEEDDSSSSDLEVRLVQ